MVGEDKELESGVGGSRLVCRLFVEWQRYQGWIGGYG